MTQKSIPEWQKEVYALAQSKGWYDNLDLKAHRDMASLAIAASAMLSSESEDVRKGDEVSSRLGFSTCDEYTRINTLTSEQHIKIARLWLIASEVFEAIECVVSGQDWSDRYERKSVTDENGAFRKLSDKPEGLAVELADVAIRLLDFCEAYKIPLDSFMSLKHAYNVTRPIRHGGKKV